MEISWLKLTKISGNLDYITRTVGGKVTNIILYFEHKYIGFKSIGKIMKSYYRIMLGPKSVYAEECYRDNFIGGLLKHNVFS